MSTWSITIGRAPRLRRSRSSGWASLAIAAGLVLASVACGGDDASSSSSQPSSDGPSGELVKIRQQYIPAIANLPYALAVDYAADFGIELESSTSTNMQEITTAAVRGDLDVFVGTPTIAITAAEEDIPVVLIATGARGSTQILAATDLDLDQDDWDGLSAVIEERKASGSKLKWGSPVAGSTNFVECFFTMKEHGIDPDVDLEIVPIQNFPEQPPALIRGDVDLLCTPEPFAHTVIDSGKGELFALPFDTDVDDLLGAVATTRDVLDDESGREGLVQYLRLIQHVLDEIERDPTIAIDAIVEMTGGTAEAAADMLETTYWDLSIDEAQIAALASFSFELEQTQKDWSCCVGDFIDASLLKEAR